PRPASTRHRFWSIATRSPADSEEYVATSSRPRRPRATKGKCAATDHVSSREEQIPDKAARTAKRSEWGAPLAAARRRPASRYPAANAGGPQVTSASGQPGEPDGFRYPLE